MRLAFFTSLESAAEVWELEVTTTGSSQAFDINIAAGSDVDINIDWGDSTVTDYNTTGVKSNTYTDAGTYTVKISNILGKKIWETNYKIDKSGIFKENLSHLSKGPYLYSITGPDGERILPKKMTIMKP